MENTRPSTTASGDRILSIDALRGFIMILMALDHANSFLSFGSSSEFWGGALRQFETSADFLVRFVTHLCAPGFFFLMGISMIYLAGSRRQKKWTDHQIRHYFFIRGSVIILIHFALSLITAVPRLMQGNFGIVFNVLFILGLSMQVGALLIHAAPSTLAALSLISFTIPQLILGRYVEFGQRIHPILQLLFVPGPMGNHTVYYTLFSWIGFCFAGLLFGKLLYRDRADTMARIPLISAAALILFVIVRWRFGNLRPAADPT